MFNQHFLKDKKTRESLQTVCCDTNLFSEIKRFIKKLTLGWPEKNQEKKTKLVKY